MGSRQYGKVVFAGTFDHLHIGHKHVLRTALQLGEKVAVGLTTDTMLEGKSYPKMIQSYETRYKNLENFLREEGAVNRSEIFPIETKEGGADKMRDLEALVVSDELNVVDTAFEINELRIINGLKRFHIIVVPLVRTKDGRPVSSSRIRAGEEIDDSELIY